MLGTAFPAARLLLVEQPGPWGFHGLRESDFDRDAAAALVRRAGSVGVRVEAIRRPGRTAAGSLRRWALVDARDGQERLCSGEFGADAELLQLPLDGSVGASDDRPLYLVCAHGKHDPCCALRGRPVASRLSQLRPGQVWECSHLGGDRFAANVLVVPSGVLYGRVPVEAAGSVVAAAESGTIITGLLRGRIGFAPAAQAALAFGYDQLALRRADEIHVLSASPPEHGVAHVSLGGPHGALDVLVRVERVAAAGLTCGNPGAGHFYAYHPEFA
jgi:hypothetical protein